MRRFLKTAAIASAVASAMLIAGCAGQTVTEMVTASTPAADADVTYAPYSCFVGERLLPALETNSSMDAPRDHGSEFQLVFEGDWDQVTDPDYQRRLENTFYAVYPKLYARWGTGAEPKTIRFIADSSYDGVAASWDNCIEVSTDYANEAPLDLGYFVHELTHNVQSYNGMDWWCENMASYAGFRYFHWSYADAVKLPDPCSDEIHDWRYKPYGECMLFYSYLDTKFPTGQGPAGERIPGLLDAIHFAVKDGTITEEGDPADPDTPFNRVVRSVTGAETIEELRQRFISELDSREWIFTGFADIPDLFVTDGAGDSITEYPVLDMRMPVPSASNAIESYLTPAPLSEIGSGSREPDHAGIEPIAPEDSVFKGAAVVRSSGFIHDGEQDAFLVDGDLTTKWCAEAGNVSDKAYALRGVEHFMILDLGEEKHFDTYTLYNGGSKEISEFNASCWELLVSRDGEMFYRVDFASNAGYDMVTRTVTPVSARYVMLRVYRADNGGGTVRLYELTAGPRTGR